MISGLRRSGKSTLLSMFRDQLSDLDIEGNQIHTYNFELPENYLNKTWNELYFEIKEKLIPNKQNYIFLDEIQNIPSFERLVDGLFASENTDVYVTGSNAYLLSSELATLLSGRYVEISILPFSFKEYLSARKIDFSNKYLNYEAFSSKAFLRVSRMEISSNHGSTQCCLVFASQEQFTTSLK